MDKTITYDCGLFWEPLADGHSEQADFEMLDKLAMRKAWNVSVVVMGIDTLTEIHVENISEVVEFIRDCLNTDTDVSVICRAGNVTIEFINA